MIDDAFPDRIGIGDGPEVPCRVIAFDFARDPADDTAVVAQRDADGTVQIIDWGARGAPGPKLTVEQARFTADRAGRYEFTLPLRPPPLDAPPNSCARCGIEQRGHGADHEYATPGDAVRLARMKSRRAARPNPPPKAVLTPETFVSFRVNMGAYTAAMARALEGLEILRPVSDGFQALAQSIGSDGMHHWRERAEGRGDWGDPLVNADANWPEGGSTCAHVCGADPDHRCEAGASVHLTYALPSGGTRSMPMCGPCNASETAAKENAHA